MTTPTDPLFASQWHFNLIGDIETIWDEYTGNGVNVGVYDDGIQYTHDDLDGNYNSALEVVDNFGNTVDPSPNLINNDSHGTAVAGLIAAENNGDGTVGVAYSASITGVNVFDSGTYGFINGASITPFLDVVDQASAFDVMSNSWGGTPLYQAGQNQSGSGFDALYLAEIEQNLTEGRGGLGTIVTQAAGNDGIDANGSGVNSSRYTITVAATDINGNAADFTNVGSSILITAPAASWTTDLIGENGYNATGSGDGDPLADTNYTSVFGGTSAATPVVSGVVALMLEANSGLGWRDVQNILAVSASHTGSALGAAASGFEVGAWEVNGAGNWNGGGMTVNGSYGHGMLDAFAAVRMAEVWDTLYGTPLTSANEQTGATSTVNVNQAIPDNNPTGLSFGISSAVNISVEHIQLNLNFAHTFVGDLEIYLTDPDGNRIQIVFASGVPTGVNGTWSYGIDSFLGVESAGNWTVTVVDTFAADTGTVFSGSLEFFGSAISTDDVHHITADFLTYATVDTTRATISDTNGGNDWLNFASVADAVVISLLAGGQFTVGGIVWGSLGTGVDVFENIITSDGNDSITGNSLDNAIHGMRGNDTLDGGAGNDTLFGGDGSDDLIGGADNDSLVGAGGNDTLTGSSGEDILSGGGGRDFMYGGNDSDTLHGNTGNDFLLGGKGGDSLHGGGGRDQIKGGAGGDNILGGGARDALFGGNGHDTINGSSGNDQVDGGAGDDVLLGGSGNDFLFGGEGNDTLTGGGGSDKFIFRTNGGTDTVLNFADGVDSLWIGDHIGGFGTLVIGDVGADLSVTYDGGTIILDGLAGTILTVDDFNFI